MSSTFGNKIQVSIFGQSHGEKIGCVIDGLPAGEPVDTEALGRFLARRAPGQKGATQRRETDAPRIVSGVLNGMTCGAPLCVLIDNADTRSGDYEQLRDIPRPGHADYPAAVKFRGYQDVRGGGHFSARTEDASGIPDMVPVLAALLTHPEGTSVLSGAGRLRLKESDRLESVCAMVNALGGRAETENDSLIIRGRGSCPGGRVNGFGDHRIVMAAAVGASRCLGPSEIGDAEAVRKSYPSFWDDLKALGGGIDVVGIRE